MAKRHKAKRLENRTRGTNGDELEVGHVRATILNGAVHVLDHIRRQKVDLRDQEIDLVQLHR